MFIVKVDCGDDVLCDICNEDFTVSDETGGTLYGSYAVCPKCSTKFHEKPDDCAKEGETFRDFVYRIRRR